MVQNAEGNKVTKEQYETDKAWLNEIKENIGNHPLEDAQKKYIATAQNNIKSYMTSEMDDKEKKYQEAKATLLAISNEIREAPQGSNLPKARSEDRITAINLIEGHEEYVKKCASDSHLEDLAFIKTVENNQKVYKGGWSAEEGGLVKAARDRIATAVEKERQNKENLEKQARLEGDALKANIDPKHDAKLIETLGKLVQKGKSQPEDKERLAAAAMRMANLDRKKIEEKAAKQKPKEKEQVRR